MLKSKFLCIFFVLILPQQHLNFVNTNLLYRNVTGTDLMLDRWLSEVSNSSS